MRHNHVMQRRWIIRTFVLIPFLIFGSAWGWNCFCDEWLSHSDADHRQTTLGLSDHDICFAWRLETSAPQGWYYDHIAKWKKPNYQRAHFSIFIGNGPENRWTDWLSRIGINAGKVGYGEYFVYLPLWIPSLMSAAIMAIIWRKTRKLSAARAFVVLPANDLHSEATD